MHPKIKQAIEEIDAALFSSDTFVNKDNREVLEVYLIRWQRKLKDLKKLSKPYPKGIRGEKRYVDYDDVTKSWCVFGEESGHAYSSWSDEETAKQHLKA